MASEFLENIEEILRVLKGLTIWWRAIHMKTSTQPFVYDPLTTISNEEIFYFYRNNYEEVSATNIIMFPKNDSE